MGKIVNEDRAAMARIAGNIAAKYGDDGFKGKLTIKLEGAGGQSFGAFVVGGMDVQLVGEANDYVCKSISGGTVSIMPPRNAGFKAEDSTIAGNTCLYGATGGKIFINGRAGERFAVKFPGANCRRRMRRSRLRVHDWRCGCLLR